MSNRQYIGARYVPKFYEGSEGAKWENGVSYEALTIVQYLNESYTSKKPVPNTIGTPNNNPEYWAHTGAYNAQVQQYKEQVEAFERDITSDFEELSTNVNNEITDFKNSVTSDINEFKDDINNDMTEFETGVTNNFNALSDDVAADIDEYKGQVNAQFASLSSDINNDISLFKTSVNGQIAEQDSDLATMSARIDNIASLPSGSTSGDAELQDIRVGYNGYTYLSAGAAVRGQIEDIHNTGLLFKGDIPNNTNIDAFYTIGIYYCSTTNMEDNNITGTLPYGTGEFLLINEGSSNAVKQSLVWLTTNNTFSRVKVGVDGTFSVWNGETRIGVDSYDFNSTDLGYFFFQFTNASNVPATFVANSTDYIMVFNHGFSSQIFTQEIYNFTTGGYSVRNHTGAGWTRMTMTKYYHPDYATATNNKNMDNLFVSGLYYVNLAYWTGTLPPNQSGDAYLLEVESVIEASGALIFCKQTLTRTIGNKQEYIRTKQGNNSWTSWRGVYNNTYSLNYPTGTSIDNFVETGIFYANGSYFNGGTYPYTIVANDIFYVINTGVDGLIYQMLFNLTTNVLSARTKVGANWTGWKAVTKAATDVADSMQGYYDGKVANVIGDSIVQMNLWQPTMSQMLGLTQVNNYGVGGCCMASSALDDTYAPVVTRYGSMVDTGVDIIIVHAGTNDYSAQIPLGDENSTDITTFNGALNTIMRGLRSMYPNKTIVFNNILSRYTDDNDTRPIKCNQYREAIKNRCLANHVLFNDTYKDIGFDFVNERTATDDGLHPNAAGGVIMGHEVAGFIFTH